MSDIGYFSMYARFETESKEDAAAFLGADNIIGDAFLSSRSTLTASARHGS